MKIPKANSPDLWKYPKLLAEIIFAGMTVDEIVDRCVQYAEQDWELAEGIPFIKCVVPQVLAEEIIGPPSHELLNGMLHIYPGVCMMDHGIQAEKGYCPDISLFFWVIQSAYYLPDDTTSVPVDTEYLKYIAQYSLNPETPKVVSLLHEATRDIVLAYGWPEFMSAADAHDKVCRAMNRKPQIEKLFIAKLRNYMNESVSDESVVELFSYFIKFVKSRLTEDEVGDYDLKELVCQAYDWLGGLSRQGKYESNKDILELIYNFRRSQQSYINGCLCYELFECRKKQEKLIKGTDDYNKAEKLCSDIEARRLPYPEKP